MCVLGFWVCLWFFGQSSVWTCSLITGGFLESLGRWARLSSLFNLLYICIAGYTWSWVNHDKHYVDPTTGDHTNKIESSWFAVKRQLPRGGKYDLKRFFFHLYLFGWYKLANGQINPNIQWYIKLLNLTSYLTTFLWKRSMRNQGKDEFVEFLKLLSMAQRAADRDFDTSRVIQKIY